MVLTKAQEKIFNESEEKREIFLYGGARSGKTTLIILKLIIAAIKYPLSVQLIVRASFVAIELSFINLIVKILKKLKIPYSFKKSVPSKIFFSNGSQFVLIGLREQEMDKILGSEYLNIFINEANGISRELYELLKTRLSLKCFDKNERSAKRKMYLDCNPPSKSHWLYKYFIRERDESHYVALLNPSDNPHLEEEYIENLKKLSLNMQNKFLYGKFQEEKSGIFKAESIKYREQENDIVVLGLDIAVSVSAKSSLTGIVEVGYSFKTKRFQVRADYSGKMEVGRWAELVREIYKRREIDFIILERNQGGDLIKKFLEKGLKEDETKLKIKEFYSTTKKFLRIETLSHFYNLERIIHKERLERLEDELLLFPNYESNDRIDALSHVVFYIEKNYKSEGKKINLF